MRPGGSKRTPATRCVFPLHLLVTFVVSWLQHEQHEIIAYLREENRVLKAQLRTQRARLTDDDRRRLAALGARLGRRSDAGRDDCHTRHDSALASAADRACSILPRRTRNRLVELSDITTSGKRPQRPARGESEKPYDSASRNEQSGKAKQGSAKVTNAVWSCAPQETTPRSARIGTRDGDRRELAVLRGQFYPARRLARSSRTCGTSSTGISIAVCVVDSYAASSSATASSSDCAS